MPKKTASPAVKAVKPAEGASSAKKPRKAATSRGKPPHGDEGASLAFIDQEYEVVLIDDVHPHPENPNKGDLELIGESIDVNGWYGAVIVQRSSGRILAGNHRWAAARDAGAEHIPVIFRDVDDVVALRILLADNETARAAEVDQDKVSSILRVLGSVAGTGLRRLEEADRAEEAEAARKAEEALDVTPGDGFETQYGLLVVCDDEAQQEQAFMQLRELGYKVRSVSV